MKIQLLSYKNIYEQYPVSWSSILSPYTFDSYDVNIVDLRDKELYENNENNRDTVNKCVELQQIKQLIENANKPVVIIIPSNLEYKYYWGYTSNRDRKSFLKSTLLSNMLSKLSTILKYVIFPSGVELGFCYEKSVTKCGHSDITSDFCFDEKSVKCIYDFDFVTRAKDSEKPTTFHVNNTYITTLNVLYTADSLNNYLKFINLSSDVSIEEPEWIEEVIFGDDEMQKESISCQKEVINGAKEIIKNASNKLKENSRYKSILYANGEQLVEVVFDILEKIFLYDLSEFKDEKKEDFLIKLGGVTFIGEIKGITSNVKSEHVSQLDLHFQGYQDKLRENDCVENVKALLIINPLRNKKPSEREPIHEIQEKLAKRNESLIITTDNLLKIYDMFVTGAIDGNMIKREFISQTGLLSMNSFE